MQSFKYFLVLLPSSAGQYKGNLSAPSCVLVQQQNFNAERKEMHTAGQCIQDSQNPGLHLPRVDAGRRSGDQAVDVNFAAN